MTTGIPTKCQACGVVYEYPTPRKWFVCGKCTRYGRTALYRVCRERTCKKKFIVTARSTAWRKNCSRACANKSRVRST